MTRFRIGAGIVAAAAFASTTAWAGPAHVLSSRVLAPTPQGATYAISPRLDASTRDALRRGLDAAGLRTVPLDDPHDYLVTVRAQAQPLCTSSCSVLVGHDIGPLSDAFRHVAVVAAAPTRGAYAPASTPLAWYTYLQSDGLSSRSGDYLPALLQYGARAYGRDTAPEAPPKTSRPVPLIPGLMSAP